MSEEYCKRQPRKLEWSAGFGFRVGSLSVLDRDGGGHEVSHASDEVNALWDVVECLVCRRVESSELRVQWFGMKG